MTNVVPNYAYPTHYYDPNVYWYTYPQKQQTREVRKTVTEIEYDENGRAVRETITETVETVPYYPVTWTDNKITFNASADNTPLENVESSLGRHRRLS